MIAATDSRVMGILVTVEVSVEEEVEQEVWNLRVLRDEGFISRTRDQVGWGWGWGWGGGIFGDENLSFSFG